MSRSVIFLVALAGLAFLFYPPLVDGFLSNPYLNGLIIGMFLFGVVYTLKALLDALGDARAVERAGEVVATARRNNQPVEQTTEVLLGSPRRSVYEFLRTVYRVLRQGDSTTTLPYLLDSLAARGEDRRALVRYLTGALILLGLIGTFWGLLITIGGVRDVIGSLTPEATGDTLALLAGLKDRLAVPLGGMSQAFSTSLFGLLTSLALAFLELQLFHAHNQLHARMESLVVTELVPLWQQPREAAGPVMGEGDSGGWRYVASLFGGNAERLDKLTRVLEVLAARDPDFTAGRLSEQIGGLAERLETLRGTLTQLEYERGEGLRRELRLIARALALREAPGVQSNPGDTTFHAPKS